MRQQPEQRQLFHAHDAAAAWNQQKHRNKVLLTGVLIAAAFQIGSVCHKSSIWWSETLQTTLGQIEKQHQDAAANIKAGNIQRISVVISSVNETDGTAEHSQLSHLSPDPSNVSFPHQQRPIILTADASPLEGRNYSSYTETSSIIPNPIILTANETPLEGQNQSSYTETSSTIHHPISPTSANLTSSSNQSGTIATASPVHNARFSLEPSAQWLLTNQSTPNTTYGNDSSVADLLTKGILDLLPWEIQSIRDYKNVTDSEGIKLIGACRTPHESVQDSCCLGSFSKGGLVTRERAHYCFKGEATYDRVANTVLRELQRTDHLVDEDCDLCRVVDLINKFDLKFAISGDSMMSQNMDGFFCELHRRGYRVGRVNTTLMDQHTMVGMKEIWTHEITGPAHWQRPTKVHFLFQYRPIMSQFEEHVAAYDVLVMNFGLHWDFINDNGHGTNKVGYEETMTKVLNATLRHGNITLLAHRETSAQHHNYTAGEWAGPSVRTSCTPLNRKNHSHIIGWRERVFQAKAKEIGYKVVVADETLASAGKPVAGQNELVILPFFNLTASMHYLHPDECTHYCSTPYLWMPIWRSLRLAMDRQWSHHV